MEKQTQNSTNVTRWYERGEVVTHAYYHRWVLMIKASVAVNTDNPELVMPIKPSIQ